MRISLLLSAAVSLAALAGAAAHARVDLDGAKVMCAEAVFAELDRVSDKAEVSLTGQRENNRLAKFKFRITFGDWRTTATCEVRKSSEEVIRLEFSPALDERPS